MSQTTIGQMRMSMTLEAPIDALDDSTGFVRSYKKIANLWARVAPVRGEARFLGDRQEQVLTYVVVVRWRSDIASGMRLTSAGRALLIRAVYDRDGRRRYLTCSCEEIT